MKKLLRFKELILVIYAVLVFVGGLFGISALLNRGNTDMTAGLAEPTLPTLVFTTGNMDFNLCYGYLKEMTPSLLREDITPMGEDRTLSFRLDTYGMRVSKISYQLRSLDGSRLIEDTGIFNYLENGNQITASITFKDLIETGVEYSLCVLVTLENNQTARYYARVIKAPEVLLQKKLEFAYYFTNTEFDRPRALRELPTYMECNAKGDNSSFAYVDIHSSMSQLVWGELLIRQATKPVAYIKDIGESEASIQMKYYVGIKQEDQEFFGAVTENYRLREGDERYYLLGYDRTFEQGFDLESGIIANNKFVLGITNQDIEMLESEEGKCIAFVSGGKVYSYNVNDNKFSIIYDPYGREVEDLRKSHRDYQVKLFSVEESGSVTFLLYGYHNRGLHEGQVGVSIYTFDGQLNNIEEKVFIPYMGSAPLLYRDIDEICYVSSKGQYYIKLEDTLYCINLRTLNTEILAENIPEGGFTASSKSGIAAWVEGESVYQADTLYLKNLMTGTLRTIDVGSDEKIMPIGFFGDALIYGKAKTKDIGRNEAGKVVYPMYQLEIISATGTVLKTYEEAGVYVTDTILSDKMVSLVRCVKNGDSYQETLPDQILNNSEDVKTTNTISTAVTGNYETIVQIALKKDIETKSMKTVTPRYILFEGSREVELDHGNSLLGHYFVYLEGKLVTTTKDLEKAITLASRENATVQNGRGQYIYRYKERKGKNQIMILSSDILPESTLVSHSKAACLQAMLYKEGIRMDGEALLSTGKTIGELIEENVSGAVVLDLTGIPMDIALSYVQQDYPVYVHLSTGDVLLIGYNDTEVVLWDPVKSSVYKITQSEAEKKFAEEGNPFLTYIKF